MTPQAFIDKWDGKDGSERANYQIFFNDLCALLEVEKPLPSMIGVYELNRIELLRDVFVRAYERSCQQYVAVRQQLVPPDALRLRYRAQLSRLVAAIVRAHAAADEASIRAHLPETVAECDRERFIALALDEFNTLHAGNAIRFGLRPLEFAAWRERKAGHD